MNTLYISLLFLAGGSEVFTSLPVRSKDLLYVSAVLQYPLSVLAGSEDLYAFTLLQDLLSVPVVLGDLIHASMPAVHVGVLIVSTW